MKKNTHTKKNAFLLNIQNLTADKKTQTMTNYQKQLTTTYNDFPSKQTKLN